MPGVNIQAPSLKPPRVSLISSSDVVTIPGEKWWGGIQYKKLSGNPNQGIDSSFDSDDTFILPICPVDTTEKSSFPRTPVDMVEPFAIYATESCSTYGLTAEEILDRARQKLLVAESWTIEHELWYGTATNNFSFADGPIQIGSGGDHPLVAFSLVDAAVASDRGDGRGMVHVTARTFDILHHLGIFRREGNVWFSPLDNIVVPTRGAIESISDVDNTEVPIYGHPGIIQIVRSEVMTFPQSAKEIERQMNRQTNDLWVVAERVVSYIVPSAIGDDGGTGVYMATANLNLATASSGGGGGGDASGANQLTIISHLEEIEAAVEGIQAYSEEVMQVTQVSGDTLITDAGSLWGWSVWNTNSGLSEITIHNGNDSGDPVVARFRLAENESYTVVFPRKIAITNDIHFEVVSGSAVGAVYHGGV